jgi:hypothetical protein
MHVKVPFFGLKYNGMTLAKIHKPKKFQKKIFTFEDNKAKS